MTNETRNDLFYVCALIEYISRSTNNRRGDVIKKIGKKGLEKLMHDAQMDHCLSFEEVSDEVIAYFTIENGDFKPEEGSPYTIPGFQDIGKLYAIIIEDLAESGREVDEMIRVFTSFMSDAISNFRSDLYYQNPDYLECCIKEGYLLE